MLTRRGTMVTASNLWKQTAVFSPGDIVTSVVAGSIDFIGQVTRIDLKCAKVFVNWGDGDEAQCGPDEIQLYASAQNPEVISKMMVASRRGRLAGRITAEMMDVPSGDQFVGDPRTHGIDKPRGGGFSIMQNLQKDLAPEMMEEAEAGPKIAPQEIEASRVRMAAITENVTRVWHDDGSIAEETTRTWDAEDVAREASECPDFTNARSRRAMYWNAPGRTYRLTKQEKGEGVSVCPKCRAEMEKQKFTKQDKLFSCPGCGFKIPTSKVVDRKIEIEIEPDGSVEVEIDPVVGSSRRGRLSAEVDISDLRRMSLREIASLIYEDWGSKVNFAAKPYLEAMTTLNKITDNYMFDSGSSIVSYFLSNARSWRGDVAKMVKKELKRRLR